MDAVNDVLIDPTKMQLALVIVDGKIQLTGVGAGDPGWVSAVLDSLAGAYTRDETSPGDPSILPPSSPDGEQLPASETDLMIVVLPSAEVIIPPGEVDEFGLGAYTFAATGRRMNDKAWVVGQLRQLAYAFGRVS